MSIIPTGTKIITYSPSIPITEKKSTSGNSKQEVITIDDILETVSNSNWDGVMVKVIAPEDIEAFGLTPIELLPVAGAGNYIEYEGFLEKLAGGTTTVGTVDYFAVVGGTSYVGHLVQSVGFQNAGTDGVVFQFSSKNPTTGVTGSDAYGYVQTLNDNLVLQSYNGNEVTANTASYRAVIRYKIRTLGV